MNINNGMDIKFRTEVSDLMTQTIVEVYEKGFKKGFEAGKLAEAEESVRLMGYGKQEFKSANQQRAELIEKAKEYVKVIVGKYDTFSMTVNGYKHQQVRPVFHVNEKKRTVTVLVYGGFSKKLLFKGMARCNPTDVFNAWIGKAIALARALQLPVPVEFLKAVQPNQFAKGQVIHYQYHEVNEMQTIIRIDEIGKRAFFNNKGKESFHHLYRVNEDGYDIIDDTNAQYEVST